MARIVIIGAGGVIFARRFITDILVRDALRDSQLASLDEIRAMAGDMFEAFRDLIPAEFTA